ncbi:MAG: hypothetical protein KAJ48_01770, partial [Elusimicrobiales bacterium]|nr:hypothetical protein [Elusimicrobiales bacterium]
MKKIILILTVMILGVSSVARAGFGSDSLYFARNNKRASFIKLDKDSASMHKNVHELALRYARTSHKLSNLNIYLGFPASLAKSLKKIETALTVVKSGAKTAQGFPDLRKNAKNLEKSAGASLAEIKAARIKTEKIAKNMEPARKTVEKAAKG